MATTIATGYANAPLKQGEPPDHGFLYTGKGLDFDGVTDYLGPVSYASTGDFQTVTISCWFNAAEVKANGAIMSILDSRFTIRSGTNINLYWYDGSSRTLNSDTAYALNTWNHVVAVKKEDEYAKLYLNGFISV